MNFVSPDEQDAQDMARLAGGHDAALSSLMERHAQKLFHYLVRLLHDEADAADLAQETFVRVYQNRAKFNPAQPVTTWFSTIATNLARDRWRRRARRPEVSLQAQHPETGEELGGTLPEARPTPGEELLARERGELVRRAVASLPEDLRVPLVLAEYEGQSHEEIGAVLGYSTKAVEMRIYRARKKLREILADLLES